MQFLSELMALVKKFAAAIVNLNLDLDEQNQIETGEPSEAIVNETLVPGRRRPHRLIAARSW